MKNHTPSFVLMIALAGCSGSATTTPPAVTVATAIREQVQETVEFDGAVAPLASVNLVARVAGYLQAAPFRDGDLVSKGQLLFVIEPEPYRQQVRLNRARLDQARAEAARQQGLLQDNATSQSAVENALSAMKQAEANLELAQINLDYTQVRAPFEGVIGRRQVDVGNYVGASPGGTVLATVLRLRSAYVNFAVNERDLLRLRAQSQSPADAAQAKPGVGTLEVRAALQGEAVPSEEGVLDFIDNSVSSTTGSLQLRARFTNDRLRLIPGLYAKVFIDVGGPRPALLLRNATVQADQQGSFVYVVDADNIVARRNIETGSLFGGRREVTRGLGADERVIVAGIGNVSEGQTVTPHLADTGASRKVAP